MINIRLVASSAQSVYGGFGGVLRRKKKFSSLTCKSVHLLGHYTRKKKRVRICTQVKPVLKESVKLWVNYLENKGLTGWVERLFIIIKKVLISTQGKPVLKGSVKLWINYLEDQGLTGWGRLVVEWRDFSLSFSHHDQNTPPCIFSPVSVWRVRGHLPPPQKKNYKINKFNSGTI
jgi:hypothetical protein